MEFLVNVSLLLMVVAMTVGSLSNYQGLDFSGPSDYHGRGSQLAHASSTSPFNTANAFSGTPYSGGYNGEHQPHTGSHTADQQPFGASLDRRYITGDNGNYYKGLPWSREVLPDNLQSPVDIIKSQVQAINFAPLYVIYNPNQQMQCEVTNSGHGIQIKVINEEDRPYLVGGPLLTEYVFSNLHLHWGKTEAFGSEHFINGESYAMEGHLVTYKRTSGSVEAALLDKAKDGIVVLTFFGTISSSDNYKLNSLLDHVPKIVNGHAKTTVYDSDVLLWFLSSLDLNKGYYAYPGSLTTPPFTDAVQFFIMPNPIPISHRQLEILRTLKDKVGKPITSNRRELQPLFQRPIFYVNNQIRKMTLEEQVNQLHY